jgi:hypothetical protein
VLPAALQGNPCCEEPQYRLTVLAALPGLTVLDHHEVRAASQNLECVLARPGPVRGPTFLQGDSTGSCVLPSRGWLSRPQWTILFKLKPMSQLMRVIRQIQPDCKPHSLKARRLQQQCSVAA